jgi:hypothetical protein
MTDFWADYEELRTDAEARGGQWFVVEEYLDHWDVQQVLLDPAEEAAWSLDARVDLVRSREEERPVVEIVRLGPTGT